MTERFMFNLIGDEFNPFDWVSVVLQWIRPCREPTKDWRLGQPSEPYILYVQNVRLSGHGMALIFFWGNKSFQGKAKLSA